MKLTAIVVLKPGAGASSSSGGPGAGASSSSGGPGSEAFVLANATDVSSYGYFLRAAFRKFIVSVARTFAQSTQPGQSQSVKQEEYMVHSQNRDGLCVVAFMDDHYPVRSASILNEVLDEYQKDFGDSWKTATADCTQEWPFLADALARFQDEMESEGVVRLINGIEIVYGTRSKHDMKDWYCSNCGKRNKATKLLVFAIAPLNCVSCKLPNPDDFSFCIANVMMNDILLIGEVLKQKSKEKECTSYAVTQLINLMSNIQFAISSTTPDVKATRYVDTNVLSQPYKVQYPKGTGGLHKLVHLLQRLTNGIGIQMRYKSDDRLVEEYFQGCEIRMIHCDDFEEVCRQVADGNAVLAPFHTGKLYWSIQYCQFYTAVSNVKANERPYPGHVVLIIGAISENQRRAYYGLDSAGKEFCKQVGVDDGWHGPKAGGVCKITEESSFMSNFFMVSRQDDKAVPPKKYELFYFNGMEHVPEEEKAPKIDLVLESEPEGETKLLGTNWNMLHHGNFSASGSGRTYTGCF